MRDTVHQTCRACVGTSGDCLGEGDKCGLTRKSFLDETSANGFQLKLQQ